MHMSVFLRNAKKKKKISGCICLSPPEVQKFYLDMNSSSLAPLCREIDICARGLFSMKFNFEQVLFEPFFDVMRIFGSVQPKGECNLLFQYNVMFQPYHSFKLSSSTLGGDRCMCPLRFL